MGDQSQRGISGWVFHLVVWAVLFALPLFSILPGRPIMNANAYLHYAVMILSFMLVAYVNWIWLIDRYLIKKRIGRFILLNVLLVVAAMIITHLIYRYAFPAFDVPAPRPQMPRWVAMMRFFVGNSLLYVLVILVCMAIKMTSRWYRAENLRRELESKRTEAELQSLKSQLNPHFLFNTLNNIYSLIQIDTDRAQEAVHNLGDMLRYVLYDSAEATVPLNKEVNFLKDYIALMKIRQPKDVKLEISLPVEPSSKEIAPMLFISPIENAFKHGVAHSQPSFIKIDIKEEPDAVVCEIVNSSFPKADGDRSGSGIGIKNLTQRLELIYPGRYEYTHGETEGVYRAYLKVPV